MASGRATPYLVLQSVSHRYRDRQILSDFSLSLEKGQLGCLVGASGSGKTTALLCISGLERTSGGVIRLGERVISGKGIHVAPENRRIGMVFQDFALFPHLSVRKNIAFGLHTSAQRDSSRVVDQMLEICRLSGLQHAYPHELSGGEQQRVALARALAPEPDLLLLDEPFYRLDASLHAELSQQVQDILSQRRQTALMVTHDQNEAFQLADVGGVVCNGKICQWAPIEALYHRPCSLFVARFIGNGVTIKGYLLPDGQIDSALGRLRSAGSLRIIGSHVVEFCRECEKPQSLPTSYQSVAVFLRPENVVLANERSGQQAVVERRLFLGSTILYTLRLQNNEQIKSVLPSTLSYAVGKTIYVRAKMKDITVFL